MNYYLYTCNALAPFDTLADAKEKATEMLRDGATGDEYTIYQPVAIMRRGEIPITCEDLLDPEPPKRGRPRRAKEEPLERPVAGSPPRPASLVIESLAAPEQPDPDGLHRATIVGLKNGVGFHHTGAGRTRQEAVQCAMDLTGLCTDQDIAASPNTPGKKALLEAMK